MTRHAFQGLRPWLAPLAPAGPVTSLPKLWDLRT
jgi:hypothetical protein